MSKKKKEFPNGELYNLRDDLPETKNLVFERPEIAERLKKQLLAETKKDRRIGR